ncbi:hypothetical protein [Nocardioides dongkuii]|uniref:hypothetical protein n=1 Tax=Nocardioides dongkuii TaxID=2760089 RepID=UPI0018780B3A|nr:hypothetical protein [Nocardioides dongkuii]
MSVELIEVALPTRLVVGPTRTFPVHHTGTRLTRGLEPGEEVVVLDADGEFHSAFVVDIDFTLDDTVYVLEAGVRLPHEVARDRLDAPDSDDRDTTGVDGVIDLIGEMLRRDRADEGRRGR